MEALPKNSDFFEQPPEERRNHSQWPRDVCIGVSGCGSIGGNDPIHYYEQTATMSYHQPKLSGLAESTPDEF